MSFYVETFLPALFWINLRVAVLLVLVAAALRLLPFRAGAFRHGAWFTAICGCLLMPFLSRALPALPLPSFPPSAAPLEASSELTVLLPASGVAAAADAALRPLLVVGLIYGLGVVAVLGSFGLAVLRLSRRDRTMPPWPDARVIALMRGLKNDLGISRRIDVLKGAPTGSPYTWGVLRPSVVLPQSARDWTAGRIRNALVHELGHIKRFDCLRLGLLQVTAAIYWLNPLVWLALRECRYEAERACDDLVLQWGGESSEYAEQLVDLMESSTKSRGIGIALGRSYFAERVRSILSCPKEGVVMSRPGLGLVIAGTASLAVLVAACQATGQTVEAEQQAELVRGSAELEAESRRQRAAEEYRMALQAAERQQEQARLVAQETSRYRALTEALRQSGARVSMEQGDGAVEMAALVQALEQRTRALLETESELERLQAALSELQISLDQRTVELTQTERALSELRTQLQIVEGRE